MTVSFVVLCVSGSVFFGLLFGRVFAWWQEVKDEEQAMQNAAIKARFDDQHLAALVIDDPAAFVFDHVRQMVRVPYDHEAES